MEHTLTEIASSDTVRINEAILASALHSPEQQQVEACAVALTLSSDAWIRLDRWLFDTHDNRLLEFR